MLSLGLFTQLVAVPLFSHRISPTQMNRATSILLMYACALCCLVLFVENGSTIRSVDLQQGVAVFGGGLFFISSVTMAIESFILFAASLLLLSWSSDKYVEWSTKSNFQDSIPTISEHSILVVFSVIGACILISSGDLISIYLSIELQSFGVYVIATLYRNSESATAAGLKYFLLGGLSSALILLGSALIYSYTGITQFQGIYSLISTEFTINESIFLLPVVFGILLIGSGLLFKVAAAPFHNWAPDVYDGTPTIITAWLSTIPKISIFVFLLLVANGLQGNLESVSLQMENDSISIWKNLLLSASLLSLLLGTILGLSQYRIKRLLTYSTISHVGFLLLALSVNTQESVESFLFYLVQYTLTNINVFMVLLAYGYMMYSSNQKSNNSFGTDIELIRDLQGQFTSNPVLSISFAICLFSIAGIPPLIGFFAKQMVLYSSTHAGYYFISIVAILVSVISASYYLKLIQVIYFPSQTSITTINNLHNNQNENTEKIISPITNVHSIIIATLTALLVLFVLEPTILLNSCHLLSLTMFTY